LFQLNTTVHNEGDSGNLPENTSKAHQPATACRATDSGM